MRIFQLSKTNFPFLFCSQWKELIEIGEKESEVALQSAIHNTAINECCAILFTVRNFAITFLSTGRKMLLKYNRC